MMEPQTMVMAETANYIAWCAEEPDGEMTYHLELGNVTVHFFQEEWEEFVQLMEKILGTERPPSG